ncbi:hypothetical protein [Amycolatopsis japonica]
MRREEADPINARDGNGQPIRTLDNHGNDAMLAAWCGLACLARTSI